MCTSFVDRRNDLLIAMNFDNNGWDFKLNLGKQNIFAVDVDIGYGQLPSFGMNAQGTFVNNLFVDSNGQGLYKRKSKTRTLTSYLVEDILAEKISMDIIDNYLDTTEIVNGPSTSCHNLIADKNGNVRVVEPGRGNIKNEAKESPYFIMTNFSLIDYNAGKKYSDESFKRYETVKTHLENKTKLSMTDAFKILEDVKQDGEWRTDFSMVYSKNENKIFYCYHGDFEKILEYTFP